jgi:hypothetical protein
MMNTTAYVIKRALEEKFLGKCVLYTPVPKCDIVDAGVCKEVLVDFDYAHDRMTIRLEVSFDHVVQTRPVHYWDIMDITLAPNQ